MDCSTIDPEVSRAQHERVTGVGAGFLDAPLSGGTAGAEAGTLTVMVGGEASTLEAARPPSIPSRPASSMSARPAWVRW